jgi:hypothetical protein
MDAAGPIFISHSAQDREDVNEFALAVRAALRGRIRIFNASDFGLGPGDRWPDQVLSAIRGSSIMILWATPAALESNEVAFEVGAAFAYGTPVIPCCVHVPPMKLPWGLSQVQAHNTLDSEEGWRQLATAIANQLNLPIALDNGPLLALASRFQATSNALEIITIGLTVEVRNTSSAPVADLAVVPADGRPGPQWALAVDGLSLKAGEGRLIFRDEEPDRRLVRLTWTDVVGVSHGRDVAVPPTNAGEDESCG